jgi:hypothetical protein
MEPIGADSGNGASVISVSCNHCGAPLAVQADTRFVTCAYCHTKLEVHREGATLYTQILAGIDDRTRRFEASVEELNARERLDQLDREWTAASGQCMTRDRNGNGSVPPAGCAVAGSAFVAIFGIVWTILAIVVFGFIAAAVGRVVLLIGVPFVLFGVFFVGFAIYAGVSSASKASAYSAAEAVYRQRREALLQEIGKKGS